MPPRVDRIQIPGTNTRPDLIVEARPSECDGTAHKRRVASIVGICKDQRRCYATVPDVRKLRIGAQACESVLLAETKE
jgi:hypothetical protein